MILAHILARKEPSKLNMANRHCRAPGEKYHKDTNITIENIPGFFDKKNAGKAAFKVDLFCPSILRDP